MTYTSLTASDLREVRALNAAFLLLMRDPGEAARLTAPLPEPLASRLRGLSRSEALSLAEAPFLLFSLREADDDFWNWDAPRPANYDLFAEAPGDNVGRSRLVAAALGYLWQMARRNPYALRLVGCASLNWCERLGEQPLLDVISRAVSRDELPALRAEARTGLWERLLGPGASSTRRIRRAAQLTVLQALLVDPHAAPRRAWKTAACRLRRPSLGVADDD